MWRRMIGRWAFACFGMALVTLLAAGPSLNAAPKPDEDNAAASDESAQDSAAKRRTANKPVTTPERRPRMPAHFNKVVNGEQRAKVLDLLKDYAPRIAAKRAELKALVDERDEAVLRVLTLEQQEKVKAFRAESAAKRAATLAGNREANNDKAAGKPKSQDSNK